MESRKGWQCEEGSAGGMESRAAWKAGALPGIISVGMDFVGVIVPGPGLTPDGTLTTAG